MPEEIEMPEIFKGFIEGVIKGAWEIISSESKAKNKEKLLALSNDLKRVADLINKAITKLEQKEIPTEESVRLDVIISYAKELATPFKKKYPRLAEVFDSLLPYVASQMQLADYVIDGKVRGDAMLSDDNENIILRFTPEDQLNIANKELKKAASIIEEHGRKFEKLSE
jgi:hypothetical protein